MPSSARGVGIGSEQIPFIFDRFYKSNTAENQKGTGLGLAFAQEIAKRHDATISVSSGEDGTVFEIRFAESLKLTSRARFSLTMHLITNMLK